MSVTLYGAHWCGWTQKQRESCRGLRGVRYVECGRGAAACPAKVRAVGGWPVWVVDGALHPGFHPRRTVARWIGGRTRSASRGRRSPRGR